MLLRLFIFSYTLFQCGGFIRDSKKSKTLIEFPEEYLLSETKLRVYNNSIDKYNLVPLHGLARIVPLVDLTKLLVFVTFSFNESPESAGLMRVISALLKTKKYNVILLDWSNRSKIGTLGSIDSNDFDAVMNNIQKIACGFGTLIKALAGVTPVDVANITLVGHGMGAQIMGEAASCYYNGTNLKAKLRVIWGLDPAGMIYDLKFGSIPRMIAKVARFVYLVHTDPFGFGMNESHATVDFWVNYSTDKEFKQPGCTEKANGESLSLRSYCNHNRAWDIFAEGVLDPYNLTAAPARTGLDWLAGNLKEKPLACIGIDPALGVDGNYYLRTKPEAPYGLKMEGTQAIHKIPFAQPPPVPAQNTRRILIKRKTNKYLPYEMKYIYS